MKLASLEISAPIAVVAKWCGMVLASNATVVAQPLVAPDFGIREA